MRSLFFALACCVAPLVAHAGVVTMDFSVRGFAPGAPADPVTGRFVWNAATQGSPIERLISADLTIAGHAYTLPEIGFSGFFIGALPSGIAGVNSAEDANDFFIGFDPVNERMNLFAYALQGRTDQIWASGSGSLDFGFVNAASEPGSLALAALALLGAAAPLITRRRKA